MVFEGIYKNFIEKHLARDWRPEDGIPEAEVLKTEERLAFKLPAALREYYKTIGATGDLNSYHNRLVALEDLPAIRFDFVNQPEALFDVDEGWRSEKDFLIFLVENQGVAYWALEIESVDRSDPVVWQIVNDSPPEFYSEAKPFSRFMSEMLDWQFNIEDEKN